MMAKVATNPPAPSLSDAAIEESAKLFSAIEQMMFNLIAEGKAFDDLDSGQYLLCQRLGWDRKRITREFSIREGTALHQKLAGTGAERKAARERLEKAKQAADTESPKLREQLAKLTAELQAKINTLEQETRDAENAVNSQKRSVEQLRKMLPEHLKVAGSRPTVKASATTRQELIRVQNKIDSAHYITQIMQNNFSCSEIETYGKARGLNFMASSNPNRPARREVSWSKWKQHVNQLQEEVPALVEKLAKLREQEAVEKAEAEAESLDYYVPN